MSDLIQVSHLSKDFKEVKAVDDLSFSVAQGQVYGFLGQNGAGKSTTIRMLLTLIRPTSGTIEIFGLNLFTHRREILRQVGAIIERPDLYKYLTALENLKLFATVSGVRLTERQLLDQLEMVGLSERANSKVKTFSQGMKQRLGIATALVHDPGLIILDEPANGLDPQGIADIRKLIINLSRERKKTLVISSHLLGEMEMIADAMLIIDKGKKVVEGLSSELLNPELIQVEIISDNAQRTLHVLKEANWSSASPGKQADLVTVTMKRQAIPDLNRLLVENGVNVYSVRPRHSLEDYFLSITGN